jgi:hypothetical protein
LSLSKGGLEEDLSPYFGASQHRIGRGQPLLAHSPTPLWLSTSAIKVGATIPSEKKGAFVLFNERICLDLL